MTGHHGDIRAPVLEANQHTHSYFVDTGCSHAVEPVYAPFENGLHATGMVIAVIGFIVGLLETYHTVETAVGKALVIALLHRHHLDGEIVEVGACDFKHLFQIVHAVEGRELSGHYEEVLERPEAADSLALILNLLKCEGDAFQGIMMVEAAVHTVVGTGIGDIHGNVHRNGFSEALEGVAT